MRLFGWSLSAVGLALISAPWPVSADDPPKPDTEVKFEVKVDSPPGSAAGAVPSQKQGSTEERVEIRVEVPEAGAGKPIGEKKLDINAPFVRVQRDKETGAFRVVAPFTVIQKDASGRVGVEAPFVVIHAEGDDDEKADKKSEKKIERRTVVRKKDAENKKVPFLGVATDAVPEPLAAQFPDTLSDEQGLLVAMVSPDSPAAKAGLKRNDVLVAFGDQKLFSSDQLAKLVRSQKTGDKVSLSVLRAGKVLKLDATLGEHETNDADEFVWQTPVGGPEGALPGRLRILQAPGGNPEIHRALRLKQDAVKSNAAAKSSATSKSDAAGGDSRTVRRFSSMSMTSTGDNKFKVQVEWQDGDKKESLNLEGTRDEIRKGLEKLPEELRRTVTNALDESAGDSKKGSYRLRFGPGVGGDEEQRYGVGVFVGGDGQFKYWNPGREASIESILEALPEDIPGDVRDRIAESLKRVHRIHVNVVGDPF